MTYHCDDCGRLGTPLLRGRVLACPCGSVELRWLPPLSAFGQATNPLDRAPAAPQGPLDHHESETR